MEIGSPCSQPRPALIRACPEVQSHAPRTKAKERADHSPLSAVRQQTARTRLLTSDGWSTPPEERVESCAKVFFALRAWRRRKLVQVSLRVLHAVWADLCSSAKTVSPRPATVLASTSSPRTPPMTPFQGQNKVGRFSKFNNSYFIRPSGCPLIIRGGGLQSSPGAHSENRILFFREMNYPVVVGAGHLLTPGHCPPSKDRTA